MGVLLEWVDRLNLALDGAVQRQANVAPRFAGRPVAGNPAAIEDG
jgi:hypothetical protein